MPRYPKRTLDEKLAWMRDRQRAKEDEAARREAAAAKPVPAPLPAPPAQRKMLRVDAVAEILAVSTKTVQRWFADRALIVQAGPVRTTMLIPQQALDDWFREHEPSSR